VYITSANDNVTSVIDSDPGSAKHNQVVATVPVGQGPVAAAVRPDNIRVDVANGNTVSVICVVPHWGPLRGIASPAR
jgi:DNA-binding beta-propeller fold protein YncE